MADKMMDVRDRETVKPNSLPFQKSGKMYIEKENNTREKLELYKFL